MEAPYPLPIRWSLWLRPWPDAKTGRRPRYGSNPPWTPPQATGNRPREM